MIKNHLKIVWRSLLKNKGFSVINIVGLAIGMIALITINTQAIRASRANPGDSLRDE